MAKHELYLKINGNDYQYMKHSLRILSPLSILALFTASFTLVAEQTQTKGERAVPAIVSPLASKSLLTDITKVGDKLVAVGERGHIIYSTDGLSWNQAQVPTNVLLTSVSFANDSTGFVTGHDATLLKTVDGGLSWQVVNYQPELDKPLLDVSANGPSVVAVGAYGLFWQSNDGGQSWQSEFHDELLIEDDRLFLEEIKEFEPENYDKERQFLLPHFNNINIAEHTWYMAGEAGFLAKSENQGKDWQRVDTDYIGSYFSLIRDNQGTKVLAGLRGNVFVSSSDDDWQAVSMPAPATINNAIATKHGVYLFANSGNLFKLAPNGHVQHTLLADGKAVMSGVWFNDQLVLATESGIKPVSLVADAKQYEATK